MCLGGGGGLHCYNHFPEPKFLCVWGGGLHFCTFIRLLLGCALMWVRNTTCQIRLQTSDFIPIADVPVQGFRSPDVPVRAPCALPLVFSSSRMFPALIFLSLRPPTSSSPGGSALVRRCLFLACCGCSSPWHRPDIIPSPSCLAVCLLRSRSFVPFPPHFTDRVLLLLSPPHGPVPFSCVCFP